MKKTTQTIAQADISRRNVFGLVALGAATGSTCVNAQTVAESDGTGPVMLKFQSTFPESDLLHKFAVDFAERVNAMGKGRVQMQMLPVNAVVKPNELLQATSTGKLDGGLGYPAYWYGQAKSVGLWDAGPAFGMDSRMLLTWHEFGGGKELLAQVYKAIGANVVSIPCIPLPTQPLGWFHNPIRTLDDLSGLKYRTVGLAMEVFKELGMQPTPLAGGAIVDAMKKKEIVAGEWNNLTSDRVMGLPKVAKVCMLQSFHEATAVLEVLITQAKWDSLPEDVQSIIRMATKSMSCNAYRTMVNQNSKDMAELESEGTQFNRTPEIVLQAQLRAWDKVLRKLANQDALFAKVVDSQRRYARRMTRWKFDVDVDYGLAYNHAFNRHQA